MDFKQLQEEFRRLEAEAGEKTADALIAIVELKMSDFKSYIDQRFTSIDQRFTSIDQRFTSIQWMIGIAFTMLGILMVLLRIF